MPNPPRILIVEDDAVLNADLRMTLTQMGYQVVGLAASGEEAIQTALAQKPDAILMDIRLRGEINGIQASEQIHRHLDVPIIFLSAFADEALLQEAKISDAYAYLAKPVRDHELRASLEMAFYKHSAEQRLQHLNQVLRAVRDINQLIVREHDANRLLDEACKILLPIHGYRFVWIGQKDGAFIQPLAHSGVGVEEIRRASTKISPEAFRKLPGMEAIHTRQVVICENLLADERYLHIREEFEKAHFLSVIAVPLIHEDDLLGVLIVYADQVRFFDQEEINLLQELAGDIAFGLKTITEENEYRRVEDARRMSEARFKAVFMTGRDGFYIATLEEGLFIEVNKEFEGIFGYSREEVIGKTSLELNLYADPEQRARVFAQLKASGSIKNLELKGRKKSGEIILCSLSISVMPIDGKPHILGILRDITEGNRAQEQLQILKHSIDTAPDSAYWMDIQGNFIYANDSACKALGYTRAELLQMNVQAVNPLVTAPRWAQVVRDIREKKNYTSQSIHRRKDGSEFSVEINSAYIKYGDQEYINGFARDITERKLAEETLRESEEKYRALVENSIQGVIFYQDFRLVYVNSRLCEISGYSAEELVPILPQHSPDLVHPDDRERVAERTRRFLSGEAVDEKDSFRIIRKDGEIRYVVTSSKSLTVEGKPAGIVTMVDVTERNQREQELQAIATLSAALRTAPTRAEMLPVIVEQVATLLGSDTVSVEIIDPSSGDALVEAAYGSWKPLTGARQDKEKGLNSIIRRTLSPYLTQDLEHDPNLVSLSYPEWARKNICATAGMPLISQEKLIGFLWIGRKTKITNPEVRLLSAIADITANAIQRATSHEQTLQAAAELAMAYDTTLEGWARALELRDQETEGHTRRVVDMTVLLAQTMGIHGLDLENVRRGALLHDIGKMGIPDSVLLKPGTLNEREWEIMRRHTEYARDLLIPIDYLRNTLEIPYDHHEKWDGTGYPRGLKGEEIPLAARLFAVADVWDALTSDRPYRKAWSREQALKYIREQKDRHFDPSVVDLFLDMIEQGRPFAF